MAMMRTRTKSRGMCLCLLGVALALLVQPSTDFARGVPGLKDSILAKRRPLHAGVARRAGAAQEDRRDLEEAADQRMRAEFVEEDLLLARQQLQLALAQQETAQAQVKTAQARAEESGDAKKVQAAERKVERAKKEVQEAKKEVQEAKKEVQEAKKEDSLGPQVARWHLWRGAGRFNQQLRWRCSLQWPSSAWVLGTLRGLNFPDRPACF
ncbi:unnamed protein product [Effrenium voratum]|nr:unnamed protein product [Effrenium voratum]